MVEATFCRVIWPHTSQASTLRLYVNSDVSMVVWLAPYDIEQKHDRRFESFPPEDYFSWFRSDKFCLYRFVLHFSLSMPLLVTDLNLIKQCMYVRWNPAGIAVLLLCQKLYLSHDCFHGL